MAENTYDDLKKTYQDFVVPAVKVLLKDKDLAGDLDARLQMVEVNLELQEESRAQIVIWDCYDEESHTVISKLKTALTPGSVVEVFFGYQSCLKKVFSGYLDSVRLCLDERDGYTICLEAFDVIHLMRKNRRSRIFQKDTHSAMFEELMGSYSWICKNESDTTDAIPDGEIRMQDDDDYRFVTTKLAGPENPGMEFYVMAGTAYFKEKESGPTDVISLKPSQGVQAITASWGFLSQTLQMQGCDGENTVYTASEDAKADTLDTGVSKSVDFRYVPYLDSQKKVDAWAAAEGSSRKAGVKKATLGVVGIPELAAGKYMSLEDFDSLVNGQYRILRAAHIFDETGYRTEAELGGT